jgi:hypothetical protein
VQLAATIVRMITASAGIVPRHLVIGSILKLSSNDQMTK